MQVGYDNAQQVPTCDEFGFDDLCSCETENVEVVLCMNEDMYDA